MLLFLPRLLLLLLLFGGSNYGIEKQFYPINSLEPPPDYALKSIVCEHNYFFVLAFIYAIMYCSSQFDEAVPKDALEAYQAAEGLQQESEAEKPTDGMEVNPNMVHSLTEREWEHVLYYAVRTLS